MADAWMVRALAGALVVTSAAGCRASESEATSQTSTSGVIGPDEEYDLGELNADTTWASCSAMSSA